MKYIKFDTYKMDEGEPVLRSCPKCNSAHEHLMNTNILHLCFSCGRYWIFGKFLNEFEDKKDIDDFLKEHLQPPESA